MLMAGPVLAFLTQWAWVRALESALLTIPGDVEAAGLGTHLDHHNSKQPPHLPRSQLLDCIGSFWLW